MQSQANAIGFGIWVIWKVQIKCRTDMNRKLWKKRREKKTKSVNKRM